MKMSYLGQANGVVYNPPTLLMVIGPVAMEKVSARGIFLGSADHRTPS